MDTLLTTNPALQLFGIVYLILVLKMVAVGAYTSVRRIRGNIYAAPEDYALRGLQPKPGVDEDVERLRRAHQNDLENILPFFGVGLFYALTHPSPTAARIYFLGYAAARILHSIFYVRAMQPHRTVAFGIAMMLMLGMLVTTLLSLL